jgi:hypothetical protein
MGLTFIKGVTYQFDFNAAVTKHSYLVDLLFGGDRRHVNDATDAQLTTGESKSLGMISCTGTNYAPYSLFHGEALNQVIGTSQLIGTYYLQVFAFQIDPGIESLRKFLVILERSFQHYGSQYCEGSIDVSRVGLF